MKYALITGSSSGMGKELAYEFAKNNISLILLARRLERLEQLKIDILNQYPGIEVITIKADVSKDNSIDQLRHQLNNLPIHYVVANAGFAVVGAFEKLSIEDYKRQFETNIYGVLRTIKLAQDSLLKHQGHLTIIGSLNSYLAYPLSSPYSMSKFAVRALAESLFTEWKDHGVKVLCVCPGSIKTEIFEVNNNGLITEGKKVSPPKGMGQVSAARAAHLIMKAIQSGKRELIITGRAHMTIWLQQKFTNFSFWITHKVFANQKKQIVTMLEKLNPGSF